MNRGNKLLLGVLAFVVVCVVGYALFSETITVTGTATAKGDFEITTTVADYKEVTGDTYWEYGIVTASNINVVDNVVTASATLGAPNSIKKFAIKVENTGSIPAVLKNITDENGNNAYTEYSYSKYKCNTNKTTCIAVDLMADSNFYDDYASEPGFPEVIFEDEGIFEAVLDPGEFTYFYISIDWNKNSTSSETMSMTYTFKLNWEQITVN